MPTKILTETKGFIFEQEKEVQFIVRNWFPQKSQSLPCFNKV